MKTAKFCLTVYEIFSAKTLRRYLLSLLFIVIRIIVIVILNLNITAARVIIIIPHFGFKFINDVYTRAHIVYNLLINNNTLLKLCMYIPGSSNPVRVYLQWLIINITNIAIRNLDAFKLVQNALQFRTSFK